MTGRRRAGDPNDVGDARERGQSMVEFVMLVPVFLVILMGVLEFGLAFDHLLTLSYASREGSRTGAAMADGEKLSNCADVDQYVVSSVERVLTSDGSPVRDHLADIGSIRIYKADSAGNQVGSNVNVWVPGNGPTVDGRQLHFTPSGAAGWASCARNNAAAAPDSIGVRIAYTYRAVTPLASILGFFGGPGSATLAMTDRSVMALNPTD